MSEMVDKVAKAILAAHDWTTNDGKEGGWDTLTPGWQDTFRAMARAAIEAMREPTLAMEAAGSRLMTPPHIAFPFWRAMIDAALKE